MIDIKIEYQAALRALGQLEKATVRRAPAMQAIAGIMETAVLQNFEAEGRPEWLGLKPSSWMSRAGALTKTGKVSQARFERNVRNAKILHKSGRLAGSIVGASDNDSAIVGTNVKYAAIHQFGGTTGAHEITPRNKKALAWASGRHPVKKVNHPGSKIPARPFLNITEADAHEIEATVEAYLRRSLED